MKRVQLPRCGNFPCERKSFRKPLDTMPGIMPIWRLTRRRHQVEAFKIAEEEEKPTLAQLAREAAVEADWNTNHASAVLFGRLSRDKALLQSVVQDAVYDAVHQHVEEAMRHRRVTLIRQVQAERQAGVDRKGAALALANSIAASLFDFPLAGGVKLGDATGEQ